MHRDEKAGKLVRELREARGLSPEAMAAEMFRAPGIRAVGSRTIRRIEDGNVPIIAIQFALAAFLERDLRDIWKPRARVRQKVAA